MKKTDTEQNMPYVITWKDDDVAFRAVRTRHTITPNWGQQGTYKWMWEVIGNIHDNPEKLNP